MAVKRPSQRNTLPNWVSAVVIAAVVAGAALIFAVLPGREVDYHRVDPKAKLMEEEYYRRCQDPTFFKRLGGEVRMGLIRSGRVPKEWGEGNFVPWYDSGKGGKQ